MVTQKVDALGVAHISELANLASELCTSAQPSSGLDLLERRLVQSHTTVIVPFDNCVIFVRLLNCAEFSSRLSEVAQTLDAISGIQFLGNTALAERRLLGTI